jgi:hypothetical protein
VGRDDRGLRGRPPSLLEPPAPLVPGPRRSQVVPQPGGDGADRADAAAPTASAG